MGLGLFLTNVTFKRKFQWLFYVRGLSGPHGQVVKAMPPRRGNRPTLGWKEQEFQSLTESVFYPMKPAWEPLDLTLYDVVVCGDHQQCHAIFDWISTSSDGGSGLYDPATGAWRPVVSSRIKKTADLYILSGEGRISEHWILDNVYPQHVRWGELDMDSSDVITVEVSLRYDRAHCVPGFRKGIATGGGGNGGGGARPPKPVEIIRDPIDFGSPSPFGQIVSTTELPDGQIVAVP